MNIIIPKELYYKLIKTLTDCSESYGDPLENRTIEECETIISELKQCEPPQFD